MKCASIIIALVGFCYGCAMNNGHIEPGSMSRISLGMTKQEVVKSLGNPESASAEGNIETLYYVEERPWWQWVRMQVKIVDGKVVSYSASESK